MFNPFAWIEEKARQAIINGIGRGCIEAAGTSTEQPPLTLADLQQRLAMPAPANDVQTSEDEPAAEVATKPAKKQRAA